MDMKVLGVAGTPIEGAAAFDIFVLPALLAARGAPPDRWNWSHRPLPLDAVEGIPATEARPEGQPETPERSRWRTFPARKSPRGPLMVLGGGTRPLRPPAPQMRGAVPGGPSPVHPPGTVPAGKGPAVPAPARRG